MEIITTHVNADFDCLGGMIAARKLYPGAVMVFPGAQERSLREFFLRSVSYAFDFRRARDIDLNEVTRVILVDVRQAGRIGPFAEVVRRPGVDLHIYDHHPGGQGDLHGSLEVIEQVGSTVTVLTRLFIDKGIRPDAEEATMMMLGLYEDTGSLRFSSTTEADFKAAAYLFSCGANLNTVNDFLVQELSAEQVALLHELCDTLTPLNVRGIEISIAHASVDRFIGDLAVLAHKLRDMETLDALIVAVRMGDRIFMVGRSRLQEVHVGEILSEFGGGGHSYAASATVRDQTLIQVLDSLPELLQRHVHPRWIARNLMTQPVRVVPQEAKILEARQLMTRYGVNAMPVMDGSRVVGIITRQLADRANHHGLGDAPVADYMSREFHAVSSDASIDEVQQLIVDRNQRFVPVIDEGNLVGAITRTGLLHYLVSGSQAVRGDIERQQVERPDLLLKRRQVSRLISDLLPPSIQSLLEQLGGLGNELGVPVYAVGGFVRDLLLRQENVDLDVVVEGDGIAFASEFALRHGCRVRPHRKFGTAVIIFPDDFKVDVASTRTEYYEKPGALPTVEYASIKSDLSRRDFTINTLAIALNGEDRGDLLDFFGAQRDLKEKAVRVLHSLSFVEDPTRVFRAIRFEQRLGFRIGSATESLLRSAVKTGFLEKVAGPRVLNELTIILREADPLPALYRMAELQILKYLHPKITMSRKSRTLLEAAPRVIHWYELLYATDGCEPWKVYYFCLTGALDREALTETCTRLGMTPRLQEFFLSQREQGHNLLEDLERRRYRKTPPTPGEIHSLMNPLATEALLYVMIRTGSEEVRSWISRYFTHIRGVEPILNGGDLQLLGFPPGPLYREILERLREGRLEGELVTRSDEVTFVLRHYPLESSGNNPPAR